MAKQNNKPPKHFLQRTTWEPGKCTLYRGKCGYESTNAKEFTIRGKVTCGACLVRRMK